MGKIDLHLHSNHSDGIFNPKELLDMADEKKIPAIAITDHDKATANKEAAVYAKEKGIEYISGIEITITPPKEANELHVVGLFIDSDNEEIKRISERHKEHSMNTARKIIKKLNNLGYEITFEEVSEETEGKHFGRPSIAKIIMKKYPEKFQERKQVFNELLGQENGKAFVRPIGTKLEEAINIIHNAGGIAIVAHPWLIGKNMINILERFLSLGGDGIEIYCRDEEGKLNEDIDKLMKQFILNHKDIAISGGTDFHGNLGDDEMGRFGISQEQFVKLKGYWREKRG